MKVLMLGWELPPYNSGGLGVACYQLSKALAHAGASIDFVLPSHADYDPSNFMQIHRAPKTSSTPELATTPSAYSSDIDVIRSIQHEYSTFVGALVAKRKPHVIHANDWLTLTAGVHAKNLTHVPLIAHVHATEFDRAGGGPGNPLIHEIEQHGLVAADVVVAVSEATRRIITDKYHIPQDKIHVVHNSAEIMREYQTDWVQYRYVESMKREGYVVVASIGRLTVQKGLSHLLQAAAKAQTKHGRMLFLIAGDGDMRNELIEQSAELGIADAVLFTGFVRGKAWRDVYNLADVFVMSSKSEPFGLTALEAAQHNNAITLTKQSGVSEVLHNVLRYDFWDEDKLADQLVALAGSRSLRETLAGGVSDEVARMSWSQVADHFLMKYQTAIGGAR